MRHLFLQTLSLCVFMSAFSFQSLATMQTDLGSLNLANNLNNANQSLNIVERDDFQPQIPAYTPQILSPTLSHLDTSNGLSQDSINAMLIDNEGFLWLGSEEGLDRYDGDNVSQVLGSNGILKGNPVYNIFELNSDYLILSTAFSGILGFDKRTGETRTLLSKPYMSDPSWLQYSDSMLLLDESKLLIALNEAIYSVDVTDQSHELIFSLSDQQIELGESIRAIYTHTSTDTRPNLIIGTTLGLIIHHMDTGISHRVNHSPFSNDDSNNVKSLFSPDGRALWVGTVRGLYEMSLSELVNHVENDWKSPDIKIIDPIRNIWHVMSASDGAIYIATDIGLFRTSALNQGLDYLFEPTKHFQVISNTDLINIAEDNNGNLWMGTYKSGAMLWSPSSLMFKNVYAAQYNESDNRLSNNTVTSLYQHSKSELWVGTDNGLNQYNLTTGDIRSYLVNDSRSAAYSPSSIVQVEKASKDTLWVAHGEGLNEFDIASGEYLTNSRFGNDISKLLNEYVYSFYLHSDTELYITNQQGIYFIDLTSKTAELLSFSESGEFASPMSFLSFLGLDSQENQLILSGEARLWGIDLDTHVPKLLHTAVPQGASMTIRPNSWLRDGNNRFWVAYAGIGIYMLNGNTYSTIGYFNENNALPTDVIYGLEMDRQGGLWFSSHSGIHMLAPTEKFVESYGFIHGLSSSEFNEGAHLVLSDGTFAYGGNLGFTYFDPIQLRSMSMQEAQAPVITQISLANRKLKLPLKNLSGQNIILEPDDLGFTLKYSLLNFDRDKYSRFQYRIISDGSVTRYPAVTNREVFIPSLDPGKYRIEILSVNAGQVQSSPAFVNVEVKYPLFLSPLAYVVYALIFLVILLGFVWRRHKVQEVLLHANAQVKEYNARLTSALKASNAHIWEWHSDSNSFQGSRIKQELGLEYETISFEDYVALIDRDDRAQFVKTWERFIKQEQEVFDITYCISGPANVTSKLWYRDVGSVKTLANGHKIVNGTYTNLSEEVAAKEKSKLFGEAFKHTRDWVLIYSKDMQPVAANPSFMHAFGIDPRRAIAPQVKRVSEEYTDELRMLSSQLMALKPGERYKTEASIEIRQRPMTLLADIKAVPKEGNALEVDHYLNIFTDITDQINAQKELQKLANYDVLTGLINRSLLIERLRQAIHYSKRHIEKLAVLFIDLDRFKPINDTFGHEAGDKVLIEIAKRLQQKFREQDSVARIGGDEFVIVLSEIKDKEALDRLSAEVIELITKPISIGFQSVNLSASIGIAQYPEHAKDPEHLVRNADIAMYSAKAKGSNRVEYFIDEMNEKVHADMVLENRLKVAVKQRAFSNYYQPIIDLKTGRTAGFEMLMRWVDGDDFIPPDVFIPIAEQVGCIIEMTENAIETVIEDIAIWRQQGFNGYVAINLSAKHFSQSFNSATVLGMLEKYKLPVRCLRFEITESLLMENAQSSANYMNELRKLGFKIALDDFGTGYSSLKYLKDFPIDVLKIDRSFVNDITHNKGTESIVYSTLVMAGLLNIDSVAEGIETDEQLAYFILSQCRYGQGYYFSKPVPFEQTHELVNQIWYEGDEYSNTNVISMPHKLQEKNKD